MNSDIVELDQIKLKEKKEKIKKIYELNIKECIICLEPMNFNLKSNTCKEVNFDDNSIETISLPCACANSVYHKNCLVRMVLSGPNKNFCPYCTTKYNIKINYGTESESEDAEQVRQLIIQRELKEIAEYYFRILVFNLLINSIINIICIKYFIIDLKDNKSTYILTWMYFIKLLFNFYIGSNSNESNNKIYYLILFNNIVQYILVGFVIILENKIPYKIFVILISVQITLSFLDLAIRLYYKLKIKVITNRIEGS